MNDKYEQRVDICS